MILGITGHPGAGKSSVVDILEVMGFTHYTNKSMKKFYGDILNKENNKNKVLKFIENIFNKSEKEYRVFDPNARYVIEPIKSVSFVEKLKKIDEFYLIHIQTDLNTRFKRYKEKISKEGAKKIFSWEDFRDIKIPKKLVNMVNYEIDNNSWYDLLDEKNDLVKKVYSVLEDIKYKQKNNLL